MKRSWIPGILALLLLAMPALSDNKPAMEDVAGKLGCYCGTCPHLVVTKCGCGTAEQIKKDVQKMIDQGMTEQQILDSYVAQYGQTVLAAPTGTGFNLTAWLAPFLAFAFGGVVLFKFLKRQQRPSGGGTGSPGGGDGTPPSASATEDENYREMLRKEMEERR